MSLTNLNLMIYHADLQPARRIISRAFFLRKNKKGFNGERGILGRQKVVCGSNVQVLTSHAGLNLRSPRSCITLSLAASFVSGKSRLVTRRNGELSNESLRNSMRPDGVSGISGTPKSAPGTISDVVC